MCGSFWKTSEVFCALQIKIAYTFLNNELIFILGELFLAGQAAVTLGGGRGCCVCLMDSQAGISPTKILLKKQTVLNTQFVTALNTIFPGGLIFLFIYFFMESSFFN